MPLVRWALVLAVSAGPLYATSGALSVSVESEEGASISGEIYLAVTPVGGEWRAPVFEGVLPVEAQREGTAPPFTVQLSPGQYEILCSAVGYGIGRGGPVTVGTGWPVEARCPVALLVERGARIVDAVTRQPVPNGIAGPAALFAEQDFPGRLSPLGEDHLRQNLLVSGGRNGELLLRGPKGEAGVFWFQAPGFAPVLKEGIHFSGNAMDPLTIPLPRGGSLVLHFKEDSGNFDPPSRIYLQYLAEGTGSESRIPAALLTRLFQGQEILEWPSLTPGRIRVLAKGKATGAHEPLPMVLTEVEIVQGQETATSVDWRTVFEQQAEAGRRADLSLRVTAPGVWPEALRLFRQGTSQVAEVKDFLAMQDEGGVTLAIPHGCQEGHSYVIDVGDRISRPLVLEPGSCPQSGSTILGMEAAAGVQVSLTGAVGQSYPPYGQIWVERCADGSDLPERQAIGMFPAEILEGTLTAHVPAGCHTLSVNVPGFTPHTFLNRVLVAGRETDLGTIPLRPGAAVLARIVDGDSREPRSWIRVQAIPEEAYYRAAEQVYSGLEWSGAWGGYSSEAGWVRLTGLSAGRYYLLLTPPERDRGVPIFHGPMEMDIGKELILEDVPLEAPGALTVVLDSGSLPGAEAFTAELQGYLNPGCGRLNTASLVRQIRWMEPLELEDLVPGDWEFSVTIQGPVGSAMEVARQEIEVRGSARDVLPLSARGDFFVGQLLFRGEPVAARLEFLPQFPFEGTIPQARAGEEGFFLVGLPEPGMYQPHYALPGQEISLKMAAVEFEDPETLVILELPPYTLQGKVVDEDGKAVPGAGVILRSVAEGEDEAAADETVGSADHQGEFQFRGLADGRWSLMAVALPRGESRSRWTTLDLGRSDFDPEVTLTVGEGTRVAGTLTMGRRPLARVALRAWLVGESPGDSRNFYVLETDAEGRFDLAVDITQSSNLNVELTAPGFPVSARRWRVSGDRQLDFPAVGGRLVVKPAAGVWQVKNGGGWVLVYEDGGVVELYIAAGGSLPSNGSTESLVLPNLAPGRWGLLRWPLPGTAEFSRLMHGQGATLPTMVTFDITAGVTTEVVLEGL